MYIASPETGAWSKFSVLRDGPYHCHGYVGRATSRRRLAPRGPAVPQRAVRLKSPGVPWRWGVRAALTCVIRRLLLSESSSATNAGTAILAYDLDTPAVSTT